jgi:hypothetical protein
MNKKTYDTLSECYLIIELKVFQRINNFATFKITV